MKALILSAEHAGNQIPAAYAKYFSSTEAQKDLASHRGYDLGTEDLYNYLCQTTTPVYHCNELRSRLLIEYNRSENNSNLFSVYSKKLNKEIRKQLTIEHAMYRKELSVQIAQAIKKHKKVVHIALHSFTPVLDDEARNCDMGLLYDPQRELEKIQCHLWKKEIGSQYRVRFNYPYRGTADGLTTYMRSLFEKNYIGIELELNQGLIKEKKFPMELKKLISYLLHL